MSMSSSQALQEDLTFNSPFDIIENDFVTLVEQRMRKFASEITEKPRWYEKVFDEGIVSKWRQEFKEQDSEVVKELRETKKDGGGEDSDTYGGPEPSRQWPRDRITDVQLDWVFDYLRWAAREREAATGIETTGINKIYRSSELIPTELKSQLINDVSIFENVPSEEKDWHPGSNGQVLDLVHPSLYCFRVGKSLIKDPETGRVFVPTVDEYLELRNDLGNTSTATFTSLQHQWIPTDFRVSKEGDVRPLAYINNMHPRKHAALYKSVTAVIQRFIPLWERTLNDALNSNPPLAVQLDPLAWYVDIKEPKPDYVTFHDAGKLDQYDAAYEEWEETYKWPKIPEPAPFSPPPREGRRTISLRGRDIQVIVKLANIVLTPEKPAYEGGSWHVEGMRNESIVATGIYYYESSNITESRLAFRAAVGDGTGDNMDIPYEQSDQRGYMAAYGINGNGGPLNQLLGSVVTKEDLCLAFPNIYQHRVAPFELADPTKPGVRKILCFFLVEPGEHILSTTEVLPQQRSWCEDEMARVPRLQQVPVELYDIIRDDVVDGTITLDEAKKERWRLMEERASFVFRHNEEIFELEFNMCEH
ncbi:hypothetical protein OBBRIDRAFT_752203 [Obba rivulosa]|uniref:Uncharacterized protein n=1 Tax=Obba rivulosa TaxID=1052685 RepID=A0A8E2B520_9APHY|nr:hypothetical protein OBBRIDRAFT_752203 [Obba rivulosa]